MITVHTCRRRSWDEPPPPMDKDSPHWPGRDDRYRQLGKYVRVCHYFVFYLDSEEDRHIFFYFCAGILDQIPLSESLKDVTKRYVQQCSVLTVSY